MTTFTFFMSGKTLKVRQPDGKVSPANALELYRQKTLRSNVNGKRGYLDLFGAHDKYRVSPGARKFMAQWVMDNQASIYSKTRMVKERGRRLPGRERGPQTHAERLAMLAASRTGRAVHVSHAMSA
jgi:hypothetical protein